MDKENAKYRISKEIAEFLQENDIRSFEGWQEENFYRIQLDADGNVIKSTILNADQY